MHIAGGNLSILKYARSTESDTDFFEGNSKLVWGVECGFRLILLLGAMWSYDEADLDVCIESATSSSH